MSTTETVPVQLVLIDGMSVATARLTFAGALELALTDEQHRAFRDAVVLERAAEITITLGGETIRATGYVAKRGAQLATKAEDGVLETVSVQLGAALGASGYPVA